MKTDPRIKYTHHDIHLEDLSDFDISQIKSQGIRLIVDTPIKGQVEAIISAYMTYLTSNGYRITKEEKDERI